MQSLVVLLVVFLALSPLIGGYGLLKSLPYFSRSASRIAQTIVQVGVERNSGSMIKFGLELLRAANSKAWENFGSVIFKQIDKVSTVADFLVKKKFD